MSTKLDDLIKNVKASQKKLVEAKEKYETEITDSLNEMSETFNAILEDKWQSILGDTKETFQHFDECNFRFACHTLDWKENTSIAIESHECGFIFIEDGKWWTTEWDDAEFETDGFSSVERCVLSPGVSLDIKKVEEFLLAVSEEAGVEVMLYKPQVYS